MDTFGQLFSDFQTQTQSFLMSIEGVFTNFQGFLSLFTRAIELLIGFDLPF